MVWTRNLLRERLAEDRPLFAPAIPFFSAELVEWCGLAGFDWVFLDGEHFPLGVETCYEMVRAADAVELATLVRVPSNDPATILSYAESGVDAVMVPHCTGPEAAKRLVDALRFWPKGQRGAMSGSRAAGYGLTQPPAEYFADTDRATMAVALLEDAPVFEQAGAVAEVEGLDALFIGPGDLAMSMGFPGQSDHPEVSKTIRMALEQLIPAGKPVGTAVGNPQAARQAIELGFRLLVVSLGALMAGSVRAFLAEARSGAD